MPHTLVCKGCGKQFEAPTKRGKYCRAGCYRAAERAYSREVRKSWSPERRKAGPLVQAALRTGSLVRQPCEVCGKQTVDAHHDDYSQPLAVRWLCRSHHRRHHETVRRQKEAHNVRRST